MKMLKTYAAFLSLAAVPFLVQAAPKVKKDVCRTTAVRAIMGTATEDLRGHHPKLDELYEDDESNPNKPVWDAAVKAGDCIRYYTVTMKPKSPTQCSIESPGVEDMGSDPEGCPKADHEILASNARNAVPDKCRETAGKAAVAAAYADATPRAIARLMSQRKPKMAVIDKPPTKNHEGFLTYEVAVCSDGTACDDYNMYKVTVTPGSCWIHQTVWTGGP